MAPRRGEETQANAGEAEDAGEAEGAMEALILSCNKDGMEFLKAGRNKDAFDNFKYAEAVLLANAGQSANQSLMAVTCNNLGCYYMKVRKYDGALSYLRRALKMEVELKTDETTLAGTHLNLCSILSKLEKPRKAVQHALSALELMHKRIASSENVMSDDDYATLAMSYHHIGQCRLMQADDKKSEAQGTDQAITAFQTGLQVAKRFLGEGHPLAVTLQKNCQAVVEKAKNAEKDKKVAARGSRVTPQLDGGSPPGGLPGIQSTPRDGGKQDTAPMPGFGYVMSVKTEAAAWAQSEQVLWHDFAQNVFKERPPSEEGSSSVDLAEKMASREFGTLSDAKQLPPSTMRALADQDVVELTLPAPQAFDMGNFRFQQVVPEAKKKLTPMGQAIEDHPEALMDIIEGEGDGQKSVQFAANDFRPNRTIKRSSRTSHVVRRTGVFNSTTFRDRVSAELAKRRLRADAPWKSAQTQAAAAERIQRVWRAWFEYCQETSEWMTVTWICATMIQSHWRSYHVRRKKMDAFAGAIQRHCRGFLVRDIMGKHGAAVSIQRRVVGMITRGKMEHLHKSALHIQRVCRGMLARRRFSDFKQFKVAVCMTIQKYVRVWLAKRRVAKLNDERNSQRRKQKATVDLQRFFRGYKGRQLAEVQRAKLRYKQREHVAATKIQAMLRQRAAGKRVAALRSSRLEEMERAATFLRKVWLGAQTRKKYKAVLREFELATDQVITIQRYVRGFVCRVRLWNEAVKTEDELWASLQIQRSWRGYMGRVHAEDKLERVWLAELGATKIQRLARGWLARTRVGRAKRQLARTEFNRARERYQAAKKLQSLIRGVLVRSVMKIRYKRVIKAVTHIQRIWKGRSLRTRLWWQLRNQRSTMIQALARGFLVRNRRWNLFASVIVIQRFYRKWLRYPRDYRDDRFAKCKDRKRKAALIQRRFRTFSQAREVRIIQDPAAQERFVQRVGEARQYRMQRKRELEDRRED